MTLRVNPRVSNRKATSLCNLAFARYSFSLGYCVRINPPFLAIFTPALPTRLQYHCNTIVQYLIPLRPPVFMPYTI